MNREMKYAWGFTSGILLGGLLLFGIIYAACFYRVADPPAPWKAAQLPTGEALACYARGQRGWICVPTAGGQED